MPTPNLFTKKDNLIINLFTFQTNSNTIMKYRFILFCALILITGVYGYRTVNKESKDGMKENTEVRLITLDPGHFHAALVQKQMYAGIDSNVYVYAPAGQELQAHLALVNQYNESKENPTHWVEKVYTGKDYLEKMLTEKKGNVVVIAGNNRQKTEYIKKAIDGGFNVLGDKPMAINFADFNLLEKAFSEAESKRLLLYDIMTERSEITNILQKEFSHMPEVFGELKKGSDNDPSVVVFDL